MPAPNMRVRLARRYKEQNGKCCWCGRETFIRWPGKNNREMARKFGVDVGSPNWRKEIRKREATIEHVLPKSQGGTNAWSNLKMACKGCNTAREQWAALGNALATYREADQ